MKNLHRVLWSKGMFLTPQHFQQQDLGWEQTLQARFAASNYANYGVTALEIDEDELRNGRFTLRHAAGVFPDGLVFDIPGSDAAPAGRDVKDFFSPKDETLDVWLALPERLLPGKNFATAAPAPGVRFVGDTVPTLDESDGREEKPIQFARKNFRLVFQGESTDGLSRLRLARLARNGAGQYILQPKHVAPCLDFRTSAFVQSLLRQQIEILATRGNALMSQRREKGADQAEFTASEVVEYWLLHSINTYLPELRHYANVRGGHPELLYLSLIRLVGALSTFTLSGTFNDELPQYDHDELGLCFSKLHDRLRSLIETVRKTNVVVVPLDAKERSLWRGRIAESSWLQNSQMYLSVTSELPVSTLVANFPRLVRLSGPNEIEVLVRKALTGLDLMHVPNPPSSIPVRMGNEYFRLSPNPVNLWQGVTQALELAAFVPAELGTPRMELLIVLE